jgi:hypothetical protein
MRATLKLRPRATANHLYNGAEEKVRAIARPNPRSDVKDKNALTHKSRLVVGLARSWLARLASLGATLGLATAAVVATKAKPSPSPPKPSLPRGIREPANTGPQGWGSEDIEHIEVEMEE